MGTPGNCFVRCVRENEISVLTLYFSEVNAERGVGGKILKVFNEDATYARYMKTVLY